MTDLLQKPPAIHLYARISLAAITLAGIITTIHHVYRLGSHLLIPGAAIILLPSVLMLWFKRTGNKAALLAYGLLNAFVIVALGFVDGFLDHTVLFSKTLAYNILLPLHGGDPQLVKQIFALLPPAPVDVFYETTGVLTFIVSLVALYYGYKFIREAWKNEKLK